MVSPSSVPYGGGGTVSPSSIGCGLGSGLLSIPSMDDNQVSVGGPSCYVVGSIPICLLNVPNVQHGCCLLSHGAPPPSSVVVSSGFPVMDTSSSVPSQSLRVGIPVSSFSLILQVDKIMTRHEISSSRNLRSEPSLSDSDVELGYVADTRAKQVEAEVFGF
ncbi:hypothetical protein LWI28_013886 [Acer negundo]|uniref:Uncharacterized protein n=1 Tax=Acer negundo TaxID=4023 RepID=A0AAD5JFP7_ACENE|nr:hypothetical protein LWI28_013886 [Acer negundo]